MGEEQEVDCGERVLYYMRILALTNFSLADNACLHAEEEEEEDADIRPPYGVHSSTCTPTPAAGRFSFRLVSKGLILDISS
jgi:hypothetical protein